MTDIDKLGADFLAHYGVPGMKWGQRKAESAVTTESSSRNIQISKTPTVKPGAPEPTYGTGGGGGGEDEEDDVLGNPLTPEQLAEVLARGGSVKRDSAGNMREVINAPMTKKEAGQALNRGETVTIDKRGDFRVVPDSTKWNPQGPITPTPVTQRKTNTVVPNKGLENAAGKVKEVVDNTGDAIGKGVDKLKELFQSEMMQSDQMVVEGEILVHFGVKGMRWGVRKARGSTKAKTAKGATVIRPGDSEDFKTAASLRGKKSRELSSAELQTLTNRMQLEKKYAELTAPKKGFLQQTIEKQGQAFVQQMIKQHGATMITAVTGYATGKAEGGASGFKEPVSSATAFKPTPRPSTPNTPTPVYNITSLPRK